MGRRKKPRSRKDEESDYDSDDERAYKKLPAPDPTAQDFYMDEVDDFNETRDKIPLDSRAEQDSDSDKEEEILPLDYSDEDDEEEDGVDERLRRLQTQQHLDGIASDLEEEEEVEGGAEAGLPDSKAWGKTKKGFYSTDYVDDDLPGVSGSEEEAAQDEEEEEALAIQKRMSQMMQDADFDLQLFQDSAKVQEKKAKDLDEVAEERVIKDLSTLSKREKMAILKKESPEFLELVEDFKIRLKEVIDTLYPLLCMVRDGRIPTGPGADYVGRKFRLCMNYCVNISFYMTLKASRTSVHNHPVIARILAHKKMLKELEPLDQKLAPQIKELLVGESQKPANGNLKAKGRASQEVDSSDSGDASEDDDTRPAKVARRRPKRTDAAAAGGAKAKRLKTQPSEPLRVPEMTTEESQALEFYEKMAEQIQARKLERRQQEKELKSQDQVQVPVVEEEELGEDSKRAITYQISKNKGLTPRRKKEQRNPRVKHRMKFKKAKVRRKGQVREVRKELQRYGGEMSGIRAGVIKSVKIK